MSSKPLKALSSPPNQSPASNSFRRSWRSLEELNRTEQFLGNLRREFPSFSMEGVSSRRGFLQGLGTSLALAGLTACTKQPEERIVPYVKQPVELEPGQPLTFATAMTIGGFACGLMVESHEGHPTKIEGNPNHPMSLGATHIFHQASLLDLYDPHRSQTVLNGGQISGWKTYLSALHDALGMQRDSKGFRLRILTETVTSPTLHSQLQRVLIQFPEAHWHQYEPLNRDSIHEGARMAFGEVVEPQYFFDRARMVLALDSDFLFAHPAGLRHTRDFARRRRAGVSAEEMNRLYVVESTPSVTGSNADHRLALSSHQTEELARSLAHQLGAAPENEGATPLGAHASWISALISDLEEHRGQSIIIAGETQPPLVHALAHLMNHRLGNAGATVHYTAPAEPAPLNQLRSLQDLVQELNAGAVDLLLILGGNPVYTAPVDLEFARALSQARMAVHLSGEVNETSRLCSWHIPRTHYLESWGDARAYDGTVSVIQPLILPLYDGKSAEEVLESFLREPLRDDYQIVRDYWRSQDQWPDPEEGWRQALHDGLIAQTASPARAVEPRPVEIPPSDRAPNRMELLFRADPTVWDGQFAQNGWLQELPKPITKLTWDNAALLSPPDAQRLSLVNGQIVEMEFEGRKARAPVWVTPGQAIGAVTLHLGYGRQLAGAGASEAGANAYSLRTSDLPWGGPGVQLIPTSGHYPLATTQTHHSIDAEERQILRGGTLAQYLANPAFVQKNSETPAPNETLFSPEDHRHEGNQWGMSIDLTACVGCNACVLACQSENNIPIVGKKEVAAGREMQWIRIDTYFTGAPETPRMTHQPVPCMHCENAPCELVCPVGATLHDHEGLNLQVYNRCVGTRYCSNNCPYKVRRFNFHQYADYKTPSLAPMRNPDVTVRWRGVMEKCTYCIQRISAARITAHKADRPIRDGEIQTACQQVCPAQAIVFGDIKDPASHVAQLKKLPLNYSMLGQLNTRPRTTYLAKLRNPNPKLEPPQDTTGEGE